MKCLVKATWINLICCVSFPVLADAIDSASVQQTSANTQSLVQYLQNLGGYLGYDLTKSPTANSQTISQQLLSVPTIQLAENYVFSTFLGAIPVDAVSSTLAQFVPGSIASSNILNPLANATFVYQNYSSPATAGQGTMSVSNLMDQQTYQQDPVSQAVLNILATPDYSYCMSYDGSSWTPNCTLLYQNQVMTNVIGALPSTYQYFGYDYNQQLISQLNSNSLLGPLMYSTDAPPSTTSSPQQQQTPSLTAQNQVQQAANFIRYASGGVIPATLPKLKDYDTLYNMANPPKTASNTVTQTQQMQAQAVLNNYLAGLRVYAAQSSVGFGNLYYILSKRLPQKQSSDNSMVTSQALSEFNMATWRLFNTNSSNQNQQWINQINTASSATVQKEIATLLAEINYQMYLDRQVQERILLTNTIMLMQNTRTGQPTADFANQPNNPGSTGK